MVLQVRTYDVVPISSSLGIVEFVPGTQPLKESICTFLSDEVNPFHYASALVHNSSHRLPSYPTCHRNALEVNDKALHAVTCGCETLAVSSN